VHDRKAQDVLVDAKFNAKVTTSPRKVDVRLPGKGNPNSHGARPVY